MSTFFWTLLAFLSGAVPYSILIGRLALRRDIRTYGDGNPGAFNVFKAGGKGWGALAILLDGLKGAVPVWLARQALDPQGWALVLIALAPIAGHAWSPFLRFTGGKALAVTFGIWASVSLWVVPMILGALFATLRPVLKNDRRTVLLSQAGLLVALLLIRADWTWLAIWAGSTMTFLIKHR